MVYSTTFRLGQPGSSQAQWWQYLLYKSVWMTLHFIMHFYATHLLWLVLLTLTGGPVDRGSHNVTLRVIIVFRTCIVLALHSIFIPFTLRPVGMMKTRPPMFCLELLLGLSHHKMPLLSITLSRRYEIASGLRGSRTTNNHSNYYWQQQRHFLFQIGGVYILLKRS